MIESNFYKELGKFLYAIAKADGTVQQQEVEEIEKQILHKIKRLNHSKTHPEHIELLLTMLSFENSNKEKLSAKEASLSFLTFIRKYGSNIPDYSKEIAFSLINLAAHAYHGISQEEEKLLHEIKDFLRLQKHS